LFKCSELKLITGEMSAIDGCKLPPNASKECSGKIEELKKKRTLTARQQRGAGNSKKRWGQGKAAGRGSSRGLTKN
jgi:hypothetical protein